MTTTPGTHRLHRVAMDTDIYFTAATPLHGETEADFEEVPLGEVPVAEDEPLTPEEP